ncbi:MAG: helix-turn-helix domain-containing protein [Alphaproteobacteria bacterium]
MDAHPNRGKWLRELRAEAKITQRELAEMVLADLGTIEAIEAGKLDIPTEMLGRFARIYGMSPTVFADAYRDHGSAPEAA